MSKTVHIFDYLAAEANYVPAAVTVVFGEEPFLKRLALRSLRQRVLGDEIAPLDRLDGASAQWRDVHDELSTMALFGGGRRLVLAFGGVALQEEGRQAGRAFEGV